MAEDEGRPDAAKRLPKASARDVLAAVTLLYVVMYTNGMKVTITEFRKDLFKLVEKVIAGQTVEFDHKGTTIRLVVPERRSSRVDRLTQRQITNPAMNDREHRAAEKKLQAEMWAELQKDWTGI